jgi:hypothetical protein
MTLFNKQIQLVNVYLEAHRALELLEQYHALLNRPNDAELRMAIERVIGIFKANLFQALCSSFSFLGF